MVNFNLTEITLDEIKHDPLLSFQAMIWSESLESHYHHEWTNIARNIAEGFKAAMNEHQINKITCSFIPYGEIITNMLNDINLITMPSILFMIEHVITEFEMEGWSYKMYINRHTEMITFSVEK